MPPAASGCPSSPPPLSAAAVPDGHWRGVLEQVSLSGEQKEALLAERSRMLVRLSAILEERRQLALQLAHAAAVPGEDYLQLTKAALQVRRLPWRAS